MKNKYCNPSPLKAIVIHSAFAYLLFNTLKNYRFISYKKCLGKSSVFFIQIPSTVLVLNYRSRKQDLIFLNTYQNKNKSCAIFLHLLNQEAKMLKAGAESEVQLPVHVVDVDMLDIL